MGMTLECNKVVLGVGEGGASSLRFLLGGSGDNYKNGVANQIPWAEVLPAIVEDSAKKEDKGEVGMV